MIMTVKAYPGELRASVTAERLHPHPGRKKGTPTADTERLSQSIARTKRLIRDLVRCNEFDYSITLEFSKTKVPLSKQEEALKSVVTYFQTIKKRYPDLKWLLIPELYSTSSKRVHIHGFVSGFPVELLQHWKKRRGRHPAYVRKALRRGIDIYTVPTYNQRFGYALVEICNKGNTGEGSQERAAEYCMKDLMRTAAHRPAGSRMFYASQGLDRPETVQKTHISKVEEDELAKNAKDSYVHRNSDTGTIFGKTYIFDL